MSTIQITQSLDTSGKCCPTPIVETNKAIKALQAGEVLEIIATDVGTQTDIPAWCARTGNELLDSSTGEGLYRYLVKKRG